jgi:CheY-like chemotaxis protein
LGDSLYRKGTGLSRLTTEVPILVVIVALTGLVSDRDEEKAYVAGVDIFIIKPVQFESLEHLLKQYEDGTLWSRSYRSG